jgi:hypothetical protein
VVVVEALLEGEVVAVVVEPALTSDRVDGVVGVEDTLGEPDCDDAVLPVPDAPVVGGEPVEAVAVLDVGSSPLFCSSVVICC